MSLSRSASGQQLGPTGLTNSAAEEAAAELERELEEKKLAVVKMKSDIRARLDEQRKVDDDLVAQLRQGVEEEKRLSELAVEEAKSAEVAKIRRIHDEMDRLQENIDKLNAEEELAAAALLRLTSTLSDSQQEAQQTLNSVRDVFEDICDLLEGTHASIARLRGHLRQDDNEQWHRPQLLHPAALKEWTLIQRETCPSSISLDHAASSSLQLLRRFIVDIKHEYALFTSVFKGEMTLQTKLHEELEAQKDVLIAAQLAVKNTSDELHAATMGLRQKEAHVKELTQEHTELDSSDVVQQKHEVEENLATTNGKVAQLDKEIEALNVELGELGMALQKQKQEEAFASDEAEHAASKRRKLQKHLEVLEAEHIEVTQRIRGVNDQRDSILSSKPQLKREIAAAEENISEATAALKELEGQLSALRADRKVAETSLKSKESIVRERESVFEGLRRTIRTQKEKLAHSEEERSSMADQQREAESKLEQRRRHNAELLRELEYVRTLLPDSVAQSSPVRTRCNPAEYLELIGSSPEVIRQDVANRRSDIMSRVMEPGFLSPEPPHNRGESNRGRSQLYPNSSLQRVGSMQSASSMGAQRPHGNPLANAGSFSNLKSRSWGAAVAAPQDVRGESTSTAMSAVSIERDHTSVAAPFASTPPDDVRPTVSNAAISSINKRLADILERKNKRDGNGT